MRLRCKQGKATESVLLPQSNEMAVAKERIMQLLLSAIVVSSLACNTALSASAIKDEDPRSTIQVTESRIYPINLPAQSVADSLASLSEQLDIQLLIPYQTATSLQANPVQGNYTLPQALILALEGIGKKMMRTMQSLYAGF